MSGWITDFFRFWWALFYWNTRKMWFRLHGAHRDSCPCQSFSDSGLALDSRCEAVVHWRQPARFKRVCPLLTETKDGWRCGVDAERVRPFWGRALLYSSGALLGLYLVGTVAVYAVLRSARYEISYATIVWPPLWSELRGSQEKLHLGRAQQALARGDYKAAILSLQSVCELNPRNFNAGMTLAGLLQAAGQLTVSEHIYARLMHDVPEQRTAIARIWTRALLARGEFETIKPMAMAMLNEDSGQREAWLNALFFAARQTHDQEILKSFTENISGLPDWCMELIRIEQLLLEGKRDPAAARLNRIHRENITAYLPYYQADRLLWLGRPEQASNLITAYGSRLPADEAAFLRIRVFQAKQWTSLLEPEYDSLLNFPLSPRLVALFDAALIEYPAPELLTRYLDRFILSAPALSSETIPHYNATYLAAVIGGENVRAREIANRISQFTGSDPKPMRDLGERLSSDLAKNNIAQHMALVPMPIEVIYAIYSRRMADATP